MKNNKLLCATLYLAFSGAMLWLIIPSLYYTILDDYAIWFYFAAVACWSMALCCLITYIGLRITKRFSGYRIFAITNALLALGVLGYAIYDICTDEGFLAGILGMLLLITVFPIQIIALIVEFFVYRHKKNKTSMDKNLSGI